MVFKELEQYWENIKKHQGEIFYTMRGLPFTYEVEDDNYVLVYRNNKFVGRKLTYYNFHKLLEYMYTSNDDIKKSIIGYSYTLGILDDPRIALD